MAKNIRVCGNDIKVKVKTGDGIFAGTKTVRTYCGRPPGHTEGNCAPGPSTTDLLERTSRLW